MESRLFLGTVQQSVATAAPKKQKNRQRTNVSAGNSIALYTHVIRCCWKRRLCAVRLCQATEVLFAAQPAPYDFATTSCKMICSHIGTGTLRTAARGYSVRVADHSCFFLTPAMFGLQCEPKSLPAVSDTYSRAAQRRSALLSVVTRERTPSRNCYL